jgi:hypothetical protein
MIDKTLANHLNHLLARARAAYIHVAYLRVRGVALVQDAIMAFITRRGRLHILVGGDFAQAEPDALHSFQALSGDCEVKLASSSARQLSTGSIPSTTCFTRLKRHFPRGFCHQAHPTALL